MGPQAGADRVWAEPGLRYTVSVTTYRVKVWALWADNARLLPGFAVQAAERDRAEKLLPAFDQQMGAAERLFAAAESYIHLQGRLQAVKAP